MLKANVIDVITKNRVIGDPISKLLLMKAGLGDQFFA